MKVLVIGGSKGIGKEIVNYYSPNSFSVSRANGFNIDNVSDRNKIVMMSSDYDIIINHAYSGNTNQANMLFELVQHWVDNDIQGYIFNTGTISTYYQKHDWNTYPVNKEMCDNLVKRAAKKCQEGQFKFRITNIRTGMLDTEKSRKKSHWHGNGITGMDFINIINFLYNSDKNLIVPEIVIETRTQKN